MSEISIRPVTMEMTDGRRDQKEDPGAVGPAPDPQQDSLPFPMPTPADVRLFRVTPTVISVLDYAKGFAHTNLVIC